MTTPFTDEPTVGTLGDEDLYLAKITIAALGYGDVVAHIDALTAQLERARGIAVALEQELAQRDAGGWAARHRYATVELPDDDQHALDADGTCTNCDDKAGVDEPPVGAVTWKPTRRVLSCVQNWPECRDGGYDPHCCRFPKSCSCEVYSPDIADDLLEPERS